MDDGSQDICAPVGSTVHGRRKLSQAAGLVEGTFRLLNRKTNQLRIFINITIKFSGRKVGKNTWKQKKNAKRNR